MRPSGSTSGTTRHRNPEGSTYGGGASSASVRWRNRMRISKRSPGQPGFPFRRILFPPYNEDPCNFPVRYRIAGQPRHRCSWTYWLSLCRPRLLNYRTRSCCPVPSFLRQARGRHAQYPGGCAFTWRGALYPNKALSSLWIAVRGSRYSSKSVTLACVAGTPTFIAATTFPLAFQIGTAIERSPISTSWSIRQ
jgi:hypothetical protein